MNAKQENKVSTYAGLNVVLAQNEPKWQSLTAFVASVTLFRNGLDNINAIAQTRNSSTKGVTADKQSARDTMTLAALEVAGAVSAYGSDIGSHELQGKVDYTESDLRRTRDSELTTVCQGIHDAAQSVLANLADYGVTAQTLTDLQSKITGYHGTVGKPASVKSVKQAAGTSLDSAIDEVDKVLEEKMDKLMPKFRASEPDFFNAYFAARSIVDNAASRPAKNGNGNGNGGNGHDTPPA